MKRAFDLFAGVILLLSLVIILLFIAIVIRLTSKGPSLYWSDRVGKNNKIFKMPKFRSMLTGAPVVATHLLDNPDSYLSPIGSFLRSSSLDELPQLFSVLKGDMSFVGPRPALYNQDDLIALRTGKGVDKLLPGVTGWAQVNGRDELSIPDKVALDVEYLKRQSFWFNDRLLTIRDNFLKQPSSELMLVNACIERDGVTTKESVNDYYPYTDSIFLNSIKNRFTGCQMAVKRNLLVRLYPFPLDSVCYYDHWISLFSVLRKTTAYIDSEQGYYCRHSNNVTDLLSSRSFVKLAISRFFLFFLVVKKYIFDKLYRV